MSNKKVCMRSILIVLTVSSKEIVLLYQTAANLLKGTVSHSYELQQLASSPIELFRMRMFEVV